MTGVYERALGEATDELHPKVRSRYAVAADELYRCVGQGRMDISRGTHVLPALYLMTGQNMLFPEAGHDIPFTVTTIGYETEAGYEVLTTSREFEFPRRRRRFDSLTLWDAANGRLLDFLGTEGRIVSELHPTVEAGALVVEAGRQWLRTESRYIPLLGPLAVDVEVRDRYDETDDQYHVTATVENTLAGHIMSYRGGFTQEQIPVDSVPPTLRLVDGLSNLPPA
jgi:hypothetical protein